MTNRRRYHKDREHVGRHVPLPEYMLASPAWQSLDGNCRALYLELARRYRGPNSNNGKIPYSVREGATALHISKATANRALHTLIERGPDRQTERLQREGSLLEHSAGQADGTWLAP
jgi:hypothetical protein